VISCFLTLAAQEANDAEAQAHLSNILEYSKRVNFTPEMPLLIAQLIRVNPDRAKDLALILIRHPDGPKIDIETVVNTFMVANDVKNTTHILLEYLKPRGHREEDGPLQTKLLEINLLTTPQVSAAPASDAAAFAALAWALFSPPASLRLTPPLTIALSLSPCRLLRRSWTTTSTSSRTTTV
jgi:hypothetical protein